MGELNWRRVKLGEISDILIGGTPSRKKGEYWDKDLKLIIFGFQFLIYKVNTFKTLKNGLPMKGYETQT